MERVSVDRLQLFATLFVHLNWWLLQKYYRFNLHGYHLQVQKFYIYIINILDLKYSH